MRYLLLTILIFYFSGISKAKTIHVPADKTTIQEAIDDAQEGDTVLVAPGEYFENILFKGPNIVVASTFIMDHDYNTIATTIINGSKPSSSQNGSCVRIISGEDSSTVLEGFTLTGGTGTKWEDEHGAGIYFEGGGIFIALSSPTIRNNSIINNEAARTDKSSVSAGGGGIRIGDSSPHVYNNVIKNNKGYYGGGIVLNYSSAIVKNNIFAGNQIAQASPRTPTFGGGGVWVNGKGSNIIENNTIVGNASSGNGSEVAGYGGGILLWSTSATIQNNIIRDNKQTSGKQVYIKSASVTTMYNNIEGGFGGEGNIDSDPLFTDNSYILDEKSPCIDAGLQDADYNDPEDPLNPGKAAYPSLGTIRNDMGAYGGPLRSNTKMILTAIKKQSLNLVPSKIELYQNYPNPFNPSTIISYQLKRQSYVHLAIYDESGREIRTIVNKVQDAGRHMIPFHASSLASGIYIYTLKTDNFEQSRKMVLLH